MRNQKIKKEKQELKFFDRLSQGLLKIALIILAVYVVVMLVLMGMGYSPVTMKKTNKPKTENIIDLT